MTKILAIIPARSGSKSIIDKNIQSFYGKPLLAHSIEHALKSNRIDKVILSTDSEHYSDIGKSFGAEVPFLRPKEISGDFATDLEVFIHALELLKLKENYIADIVVHLRPTTPIRNVDDIDNMIDLLINSPAADSIRAVTKSKDTPFKMWFKDDNNLIRPIISDSNFPEAYNLPRQVLPVAFIQTASIDVIRCSTILDKKSMTGNMKLGYEISEFLDIDDFNDFEVAQTQQLQNLSGKKICFDIDGVIALLSPNNDYNLSKPNLEMINKVNELYSKGNYIILFTARGSETGIDWYKITEEQLIRWGVKFHEFHTGKPNADFYIDDKNVLISQILKN
jgi:CMP-N,N'-diacetyllegionaminic acid synthase